MPTNIAGVWRNNLEKILNFLDLIKTGVKGFVKAIDGQPLRNATIRVVGNQLQYSVTKNLGHFRIVLPAGPIQLEFSCDNYESRMIPVVMNDGSAVDMGDVVLRKLGTGIPVNNNVLNLPTSQGEVAVVQQQGNVKSSGTVTGFILNLNNNPVKGAKVIVQDLKGKKLQETESDKLGAFKFERVDAGDLKLSVSASGMVDSSLAIHVSAFGTSSGNIFHLESDEHVWGMPRLLFILVIGCLLVAGIACIGFCITTYQNKKNFNNYSFSLLKSKERPLFEEDDDDEEEETEVYRAPIKSEWNLLSQLCQFF